MRASTDTRQAADDGPFEAILRACREEMGEMLAEYQIPQEDAEDLLQETFVALVFKWESIRNPRAWLLATLRNRCIRYCRRQRRNAFEMVDQRFLELLAGSEDPPQERDELRHDLNVAISRLPPRYQDVLHLRYGLGWESSEVAEKMGEGSEEIRRLTTACLVALTRELRSMGLSRDVLQG